MLIRLTYQANSKTKVSSYLERIWKHKDPELLSGYNPVTASDIRDPMHALYYVGQVEDHVDADQQAAPRSSATRQTSSDTSAKYQPAIEAIAAQPFTPEWYSNVTHSASNGTIWGAAPGGSTGTYPDRKVFSAALSYVTGSHTLKAGMQWSFGVDGNSQVRTGDLVQNYLDAPRQGLHGRRAGNCMPNTVTVYNTPMRNSEYVNRDLGIYAQDTWTMKRLTVSPGMRFDMFNATEPGRMPWRRAVRRFVLPRRRPGPAELAQRVAPGVGGVRPVRQREDRAQGQRQQVHAAVGRRMGQAVRPVHGDRLTSATGAT